MIKYTVNQNAVAVEEKRNGGDIEFWVRVVGHNAEAELAVKRIRDYFDDNDVLTDVLFYAHQGAEYQWIVREDYYADFLLQMFKYKLLNSVAWEQE